MLTFPSLIGRLMRVFVIGYLDPGSGSLLLQLLFGGLAGLAVLVKMRWRKVKRVLGIHGGEPQDEEVEDL